MTKKLLFPKILAVVIMLVTLFSALSFPTSAATTSSGTSTRTITVVTKGNWWIPGSESITLSQTKGECKVHYWSLFKGGTDKITRHYGYWYISYRSTDGADKGSARLTGSSVKIKLKPDKTYKITISWDYEAENLHIGGNGYGCFTTYPTWKVKSTYKVSNYY